MGVFEKSLANHLLDIVYLLGGMARRPCAIQFVLFWGGPILIPPLHLAHRRIIEGPIGHDMHVRGGMRVSLAVAGHRRENS